MSGYVWRRHELVTDFDPLKMPDPIRDEWADYLYRNRRANDAYREES